MKIILYKNLLYSLLMCLFLNCSNPKNGLELEILNESVVAYCPGGDCKNLTIRFEDDYEEKSKNIMEFKITNHDKISYVFMPIGNKRDVEGYASKFSFPNNFMPLDLDNLIINDEIGNKTTNSSWLYHDELDDCDYQEIFYEHMDSIVNNYYNKLGYENKSLIWKYLNSEFNNKSIIIHPGETLFFETFLSLPIQINMASGLRLSMHLDSTKSYQLKLFFRSNTKDLDDWLTHANKKTIKENGYEIYEQDLISVNSVPVNIITE